jgi:hypothetical protein
MEKFNGLGVILENRYYGDSYPYNSSSTDELRFLTTEQSKSVLWLSLVSCSKFEQPLPTTPTLGSMRLSPASTRVYAGRMFLGLCTAVHLLEPKLPSL